MHAHDAAQRAARTLHRPLLPCRRIRRDADAATRTNASRTAARTAAAANIGMRTPSQALLLGGAETYTAHATAEAAVQSNRVYLTRPASAASTTPCRVR
ncbi:MAG: hypothetical protein IT477_06405 [Rhodanobacteraceae bacterium]|nr:hypothetical protein [Rhodanobacteraceae bacterium]